MSRRPRSSRRTRGGDAIGIANGAFRTTPPAARAVASGRWPFAAAVAAALLAVATVASADTTPPAPTLPPPPAVQAVGTQAGFGDVLVLGPGARLAPAPGAAPVVARLLDGEEAAPDVWSSGWPAGAHEAAVHVLGSDGAPQVLPPLRFVFDPQAPTIEWEVGTTVLLERFGLDQDVDRHEPPRRTEPPRDRQVPILWSPDGRRWLPLLPRHAEPTASGALAEWLVAADRPQVFLWALDDSSFGAGAPVAPERRQLVRLWSADAYSAVRDLRLRVLAGGDGARQLEVVATDLVGNETTVTWPLGR